MPSNEPKEGIGFELLAGAALKSYVHSEHGATLDLTSFQFNVKPVTYPGKVTGAGYDVSVDISATRGDVQYLIECKSTRNPDEIMKCNSANFLDAMLEFVVLRRFREVSKWDVRFVLATNMPVGSQVRDLLETRPERLVRMLRSQLSKRKDFDGNPEFDKSLISVRNIRNTLTWLKIIDLPDRFLSKAMTDPKFQDVHQEMSKQLKGLQTLTLQGGSAVIQNYPKVTFQCNSQQHQACEEMLVNQIICHWRNADAMVRRLLALYYKREAPMVTIIRSSEGLYHVKDVHWSNDLTPTIVSKTLAECLNRSKLIREKGVITLFVPGTFDVILADKDRLAEAIAGTFSKNTFKYNLGAIDELRDLGDAVATELAKEVLRSALKISTDDSHYTFEVGTSDRTSLSCDAQKPDSGA
jgi:hypothetical protein